MCVCVCVCVRARWRRVGGKENRLVWLAGQKTKETAALGVFFGSTAGPFFFSVSEARVSPWSLTKILKSQCPKIKNKN